MAANKGVRDMAGTPALLWMRHSVQRKSAKLTAGGDGKGGAALEIAT